jgi:hypothetical protein
MMPELRPIPRSLLRLRLGKWAYTSLRYMEWMFGGVHKFEGCGTLSGRHSAATGRDVVLS